MLSASPSHALATQFTHWPPWITPTLKVQASVVIAFDLRDHVAP